MQAFVTAPRAGNFRAVRAQCGASLWQRISREEFRVAHLSMCCCAYHLINFLQYKYEIKLLTHSAHQQSIEVDGLLLAIHVHPR